MLADRILNALNDTKSLDYYRNLPTKEGRAITNLANSYNEKAILRVDLVGLQDDAKGADLRAGLATLDVEDQVKLLNNYCNDINGIAPAGDSCTESPSVRDTRNFKFWVIKWMIVVVCIIMLIVTGAVAAIGLRSGVFANGPLIDSILTMATEIIKFLMTNQT